MQEVRTDLKGQVGVFKPKDVSILDKLLDMVVEGSAVLTFTPLFRIPLKPIKSNPQQDFISSEVDHTTQQ